MSATVDPAPDPDPRIGPLDGLVAAVAPPFRWRTWGHLAYLVLSVPFGLAVAVALIVAVALGTGFLLVGVGVVILAGILAGARALGGIERPMAAAMLGVEIPAPVAIRHLPGGLRPKLAALVRSSLTWRSLAWAVLRFPLALVGLVLVGGLAGVSASLLIGSASGELSGLPLRFRLLAVLGGLTVALLAFHLLDGIAWLHGTLARLLLGPSTSEQLVAAHARAERAEAGIDIARDLHDAVGHAMTASMVQAAAARRVLAVDPAFVERALVDIEEQSRRALAELDRVLGVLRQSHSEGPIVHSLAGLEALAGRTSRAGTPVSLELAADPARVGSAVANAAYRIVQEALTNVLRHAPGAATLVRVQTSPEPRPELVVEVVNRAGGPAAVGPSARTGGRGLAGIRHRAGALGGWVEAGPLPDGGFAVRARLPLESPA